ncbi:MAG: Hpt domain-containing protein [Chitinophagaceae bacterium]|nr:Hpt domain-containing protein [Chitinophagaceae bacterium]
MSQAPNAKPFIFNNKFDTGFLQSMYDDDFTYIQEVFTITLDQLSTDLPVVQTDFEKGDIASLKKSVHKVKPSFGYVGLLGTEQACKDFEDLCGTTSDMAVLIAPFKNLWALLHESKDLLIKELTLLETHNKLN